MKQGIDNRQTLRSQQGYPVPKVINYAFSRLYSFLNKTTVVYLMQLYYNRFIKNNAINISPENVVLIRRKIMNTRNNSRHRETLARIEQVFLEQLKTKELSQIRVSDICKAADINRSTFYTNYNDVYDLSDRLKERLRQEVSGMLREQLLLNPVQGDFKELFYRIFLHIRDHREQYLFYFKLGYDSGEDFSLYELFLQETESLSADMDYRVIFFKNGFNGIIKEWLRRDCRESPEQMRDILLNEYRGRYGSME